MARRKRILDDDDSDSSGSEVELDLDNDPDAREERALFEDLYQRKRRRKGGKEDALYGIFADDSEEDIRGNKPVKQKKSDWTKAPAFVSGEDKVNLNEDIEMGLDANSNDGNSTDSEDVGSEGENNEEEEDFSDSQPSKPPSPRIREEDEIDEEQSHGMGLGASKLTAASRGGIGSSNTHQSDSTSKGGIGSSSMSGTTFGSKGGIGARPIASTSTSHSTEDLPSAFGNKNQRSFVRDANPLKPTMPPDAAELAHFSKLQGSFGARMLAKMGWQAGTGLGTTGEGIVTPIESKLRPQKMGIAFKGFKEKTEQSKREARRRGEVVSDDEDAKTKKMRRKLKEQEENRSNVWKKPKKVKTKVEHRTYEQIVAEAGQDTPAIGIGQIIDATGAVPREVASLADVSLNSWSPSNDPTRIPEVRHNIRLIADACKSDLDGLAREAKALEERKKWVASEDVHLRKKVEDEVELIARLQKIQLVTNDINAKAKELSGVYELSLEPFSPLFYTLVDQFSQEFEIYRLDEIVVAAIAPLVRRMVLNWNPLEDPTAFVSTFRTWRHALRVNTSEDKPSQNQVDIYGSKNTSVTSTVAEKSMTPFESLLWNVWLPKIRTSINNDWSPEVPSPAIKLYEAWSTFLPPFIRDNLLDQLILPKVQKAVANWNPKRGSVSLQTIVFPWMPHVGLRLDDVLGDARRKVKSLLRNWAVGDKMPSDLIAWKDVFDAGEWDAMLLKYVVPKIGATLRNDFRVNPREQIMQPLEQVLEWSDILRPSVFSQILEREFFPKWLDVLHIWLIQPGVNYEEVSQWYKFWKESFPEKVQNMPGVSRGFTRGLQLMNTAIELGPNAPTQLARPDFLAEISAPKTLPRNGAGEAPKPSARTYEITFRSIVEDFAASHNLLFVPTGRAHEKSRMPMFKVSPTADGKGGLLVYIQDDAIWAPDVGTNDFRAISLDDMVTRAAIS